MNFGSYWFSDKVVLAMYRARPVGPEHPLHQITERLARQASLPTPRVYVIPGRLAQRVRDRAGTRGTPRWPRRRASCGCWRRTSSRGSSRTSWRTSSTATSSSAPLAATVAATIMMVARMAQFAAIFGGFGGRDDRDGGGGMLGLLATIIVGPLAAMLIQAAISRSREFAADRGAARIVGSPYGLADALRKIDAGARSAGPWTPTRRPPTCSS